MGLKAKWTATCDGCGLVVEKEATCWDDEVDDYMEVWGPGLPDGWMQESSENSNKIALYHSRRCFAQHLRSQGKDEEAKDLLSLPTFA